MPSFAYTALDSTGKTVKGSLAVRSKQEAYRELERKELHPVSVREESGAAAAKKEAEAAALEKNPPKLNRPRIILFTGELADMLDGGLQLEQALRIMHERQEDPAIKRVSQILRDQIREGAKFSVALRKASPSFDDLYVNLVAAGEASGSLTEILRRLSENLKIMHLLQTRVISALIYPAFLLGLCAVLIIVLFTVVLPQLSSLLNQSNQKLPVMTAALLGFSAFMQAWWWALLLGGVAIFLVFRSLITSPPGRKWWDHYKLTVPLFGPVLTAQFYAQFCQSLGNLVLNGVPLLNGLKLMTKATTNVFLRGLLQKIVTMVAEGAPLSTAMRKVGHFPGMLTDLLAVGEQTGRLGHSLGKAAERYDGQLTVRIDRLTKTIPMVVLILIGILVGTVAVSILTTLFSSMGSIRSGRY